MITNRGVKVWPEGFPETFCTDHWRCRFVSTTADAPIAPEADAWPTARRAWSPVSLEVIKTEQLCRFDGVPGYCARSGSMSGSHDLAAALEPRAPRRLIAAPRGPQRGHSGSLDARSPR
jgi:hypothetical protein